MEQEDDHRARIFSGSEQTDQPLAHRPEFWRRTGIAVALGPQDADGRGIVLFVMGILSVVIAWGVLNLYVWALYGIYANGAIAGLFLLVAMANPESTLGILRTLVQAVVAGFSVWYFASRRELFNR